MSDNVRWEPVEDHEELVGMGFDAVFGPKADGTMVLFIFVPDDVGAGELSLTPDVRLCRAMPAPAWSQEPPTEQGSEVWVWRPSGQISMGLVWWDRELPGIEFVGEFIECADMPGAMYMEATVPPPPVTP